MADALYKIATTTVGSGGTTEIKFSSIPQTYTDLLLQASLRLTLADNACNFTINDNTGAINNSIRFSNFGTGTDTYKRASSSAYDNIAGIVRSDWTSNLFSNTAIYISNYTSSANKCIFLQTCADNNAALYTESITTIMIADTNAVTSVRLNYSGTANDFAQYCTVTLYGIKNS